MLNHHNAIITKVYDAPPVQLDEMFDKLKVWASELKPYIGPVEHIVYDAVEAGKTVLLEGAQGAMLDLDHGTYPFVTSSHPTIGGAYTGLGLPSRIDVILGVFKAYSTRVGSGPLPTEIFDVARDRIRDLGSEIGTGEFGATTGRPRRIGWFDSVAAPYSARVNFYSSLVLTRLDVLVDRHPSNEG